MDVCEMMGEHLGLVPPWKATEFWSEPNARGELDDHLRVEVPPGSCMPCPQCGRMCRIHDRTPERTWRSLDVVSRRLYIHARIPRTDCPDCGVRRADVPWARPHSHFTLSMESMIMAMCREMAVSTAAALIHEDANRIWRLVRHSARKLVEGMDLSHVTAVGVDEKCFSGHDAFVTVFADIVRHRVLFVTPGKGSGAVGEFRDFLTEHGGRAANIADFTCDFGAAYVSGIGRYFKRARITFDRFHLVKLANDAMNDVNFGKMKLAVNRMKVKYMMARNSGSLTDGEKELRDRICEDNEELGHAYRLKESLVSVYSMGDADIARDHLLGWVSWAGRSGFRPFARLAKTVEANIEGILRWFSTGMSNALLEGTNSLISLIKRRARGFKRVENLIAVCYLTGARGKVDLYGAPR